VSASIDNKDESLIFTVNKSNVKRSSAISAIKEMANLLNAKY